MTGRVSPPSIRRGAACALVVAALCACAPACAGDVTDTIARVKRSVVAVGTFERGRTPAFQFRGTGFAVGAGATIVTNAHVLPAVLNASRNEGLAVLVPGVGTGKPTGALGRAGRDRFRYRSRAAENGRRTVAAARAARLGTVKEGHEILMTGFPIGAVLGAFAATHRGIISAITPIAIPQNRAADLDPAVVHRLASGSFPVFQLDATAYPGNSGSPIYDPATGDVLGVVNMVLVKSTKESALSQPSGITYAVPARHLDALLRRSTLADRK